MKSRLIVMVAVASLAAGCGTAEEPANDPADVPAPEPVAEPEPAAEEPDWSVTGLSREQIAEFLAALQHGIEQDDRAAVAALVSYPLHLRGEAELIVETADELVAQYEQIFTEAVRAKVLEQQLDELFVNSNGVMIGDGEVWFSGIYAEEEPWPVLIIGINR